jgi:AraC family transcriptional regulator
MNEDPLALREMLATPMVRAYDVRCFAHRDAHGDEEDAAVPTLVFPRRGVFRWDVGKRSVVADPNTVLLFHPAREFRVAHPADGGDDCVSLRISREVVEDALGRRADGPRYWTLPEPAQHALHASLRALDDAADALEGEEATMAILGLLADAEPRAPARDEASIEAVRERIAANPSDHPTLAVLAHGVGLSPFHLARRFRAQTGSSIHGYRTRLRLLVALHRIREGAEPLAPLALDLGFASHAHFTGAFRAAYGINPSEARRPHLAR